METSLVTQQMVVIPEGLPEPEFTHLKFFDRKGREINFWQCMLLAQQWGYRQVGLSVLGNGCMVSTVWLETSAVNLARPGGGHAVFETALIHPTFQIVAQYDSEQAALYGHAFWCIALYARMGTYPPMIRGLIEG